MERRETVIQSVRIKQEGTMQETIQEELRDLRLVSYRRYEAVR